MLNMRWNAELEARVKKRLLQFFLSFLQEVLVQVFLARDFVRNFAVAINILGSESFSSLIKCIPKDRYKLINNSISLSSVNSVS